MDRRRDELTPMEAQIAGVALAGKSRGRDVSWAELIVLAHEAGIKTNPTTLRFARQALGLESEEPKARTGVLAQLRDSIANDTERRVSAGHGTAWATMIVNRHAEGATVAPATLKMAQQALGLAK